MQRFLVRRLFFGLFSLIGATFMVFGLAHAKEDPVNVFFQPEGYGITKEQLEAQIKKWGLDKPLVVQYAVWLRHVATGDLGRSILTTKPVKDLITSRMGATFQLAVAAWLFGMVVGIPLGVLSAVRRASVWDYMGRTFALLGQALPPFWVGIVGILVFSVWLGWLPTATRGVGEPFPTQVRHFILPTVVLGLLPVATYLRLTRSAMLEVLDSEYVKFARSKGVPGWVVIWKHAFRNALIQPLTVSALILAGFLDGAVLVENVFAWPGIGRLAVQAVSQSDFPTLSACVLLFATVYIFMNFVADLTYAYVDPRIRHR